MEILTGPFSIERLFGLMSGEDVREPLRRYAPQHYAVYVNEQGAVVFLVRSKERVSVDELSKIADERCPGTAFFIADSGASINNLQQRIEACVRAYSIPSPATGMEQRTVDGKSVLVIGAGVKKRH